MDNHSNQMQYMDYDFPSKEPSPQLHRSSSLESVAYEDLVVNKQDENSPFEPKLASVFMSTAKVIMALLLFGILLTCVIASKLSLVAVGEHLNIITNNETRLYKCIRNPNTTFANSTGNSTTTTEKVCVKESAFVSLIIILVVPQLFSFILACCMSGSRKKHRRPSGKAVCWGLFGSTLEVFGLTIFAIVILSRVRTTDIAIVLMNGLFIIPVFWQMILGFMNCSGGGNYEEFDKKPKESRNGMQNFRNTVFSVLGIVLQGGGIIGIIYFISHDYDYEILLVPVAVILISIAWCPKIKELQIDQTFKHVYRKDAKNYSQYNQGFDSSTFGSSRNLDGASEFSSVSSPGRKRKFKEDDSQKVLVETSTSRGKATIINTLYKIVLFPFCCALFGWAFDVVDVTKMDLGLTNLHRNTDVLRMMLIQISSSYLGYLVAWMACTVNLQRLCFAFPLTLATPLSIILVTNGACDNFGLGSCFGYRDHHWQHIVLLGVAIWLGQFFSTTYYVWKRQDFVMAKESMLFWVPGYEGALLEQNLLLNRKNEFTNEYFVNYSRLIKHSSVYICTTMYHEADFEMKQLMQSVAGVDRARKEAGQKIEMHVFFDDGVRDTVLKKYALQLISLLSSNLFVKAEDAVKMETPYGLQMKWYLPGGMKFVTHFKDNFKVKNKKRWSQVMYMSYVIDFKEISNLDHAYILTTDADVRFTPEDIMSLMDYMSRDPTVGAVCGRTHPMGNGPLVWYQIFDYAMGHWLLKVAEDVMGSVLCCPGCFSVYRVTALKDVLPTYASSVECAMDFLTKDMGEDRWLCTLLIEHGWRLQYCASAENSTYCPTEFEEFYQQRRRWNPSSIANTLLLIQEAWKIKAKNDTITYSFVIYEVLIMLSSILGPSNVILIISGALNYAYPNTFNSIAVLVTLLIVSFLYILVCIYATQKTQLKVAKILTLIFAFIMTITFVGLLSQVSDEFAQLSSGNYSGYSTCTDASDTKATVLPVSPSTIFLLYMVGVFLLTALLHGFEGFGLIHGVWYLLCLPSGYLLLTIYSMANITDRSWGTREDKVVKPEDELSWYKKLWIALRSGKSEKKTKSKGGNKSKKSKKVPWYKRMWLLMKRAQPYRKKKVKAMAADETPLMDKSDTEDNLSDGEKQPKRPRSRPSSRGRRRNDREQSSAGSDTSYTYTDMESGTESDFTSSTMSTVRQGRKRKGKTSFVQKEDPIYEEEEENWTEDVSSSGTESEMSEDEDVSHDGEEFQFIEEFDNLSYGRFDAALSIGDWLVGRYKNYLPLFLKHGYDDTTFLPGLKEQDLLEWGIGNRGHRKKLIHEIEKLPDEGIDQEVPDDIRVWLIKLGLHDYWPAFRDNSYNEPNALADLKFMDQAMITQIFGITKTGHMKKLMKALKQLQYPSSTQKRIAKAKHDLELTPLYSLEFDNGDDGKEFRFWSRLRQASLLPEQAAFGQSLELKSKLVELRNTAVKFVAIANLLWITIVVVMIEQRCKLQVLNINVLSLLFITMYSLVYVIQFVALIFHRFSTWVHMLARVPFTPGSKYMQEWYLDNDDINKLNKQNISRNGFNAPEIQFPDQMGDLAGGSQDATKKAVEYDGNSIEMVDYNMENGPVRFSVGYSDADPPSTSSNGADASSVRSASRSSFLDPNNLQRSMGKGPRSRPATASEVERPTNPFTADPSFSGEVDKEVARRPDVPRDVAAVDVATRLRQRETIARPSSSAV